MKTANILIVEDEALVAEDIKMHIEDIGYKTSAIASSGEDALTLLEASRPDLVLMDIVLSGEIDGIDVARIIKEKYHIPVVYLTAYTDKEKLERAQETEPYGYLVKPFDERELRTTLAMSLYKAENDHKLRESKRWTSAVLHSIADAVVTTDNNGIVNYINPQAETLLGRKAKEISNRSIKEVIKFATDDQQKQFEEACEHIIHHKEAQEKLSLNLEITNKAAIPIDATFGLIRHDDGLSDGLVIAFRDMTLQRQAEAILKQTNKELELRVAGRTRELETAKEEAINANNAKGEFLATMSHELRTPLNPAIIYSQLQMADLTLPESVRVQAQQTNAACHSLMKMFDDMLDIVRSSNGQLTLQNGPFDLLQVTQQSVTIAATSCQTKGLEFDARLPDATILIVQGDFHRVKQIVEKLLDNAIKFTRKGEVSLALETRLSNEDNIIAEYTISDSGIGIPEEKREQIFDVFTQNESSRSRAYTGTGIGLALIKRLLDQMNGKIRLADSPGGGSVFTVELTFPVIRTDLK